MRRVNGVIKGQIRPIIRTRRNNMSFNVEVNKDKCTGCEECIDACPASVLELVDEKSDPVEMDECLGCETCVEVCPEGAITVEEV
jgi:NAD-dependent dihydropyrimidine dehydrogenase PreA subunit